MTEQNIVEPSIFIEGDPTTNQGRVHRYTRMAEQLMTDKANVLGAELRARVQNTEGLPPELTADQLIRVCTNVITQAPKGEKPVIVMPVDLPQDTKKNKSRLIASDPTSPLGVVLKGNAYADTSYTTASARFCAFEVLAWLGNQG